MFRSSFLRELNTGAQMCVAGSNRSQRRKALLVARTLLSAPVKDDLLHAATLARDSITDPIDDLAFEFAYSELLLQTHRETTNQAGNGFVFQVQRAREVLYCVQHGYDFWRAFERRNGCKARSHVLAKLTKIERALSFVRPLGDDREFLLMDKAGFTVRDINRRFDETSQSQIILALDNGRKELDESIARIPSLPLPLRSVVNMYVDDGLSIADIARITHRNPWELEDVFLQANLLINQPS